MPWCEGCFKKPWIYGSFSFVHTVNLPWQMAAVCNHQSSCCERLSISAATEISSSPFARSRYGRALLLSLNAQDTALAPGVCKRLLARHFRSGPGLPVVEEKEKTIQSWVQTPRQAVDTIRQKHPLRFTRYAEKIAPVSRSLTASYL